MNIATTSIEAIRSGWNGLLSWGIWCIVLLLCLLVLRPFLPLILWSAILAYVTWRPYQWLLALCRGSDTIAASMMMVLVAIITFVPLLGILALLQHELRDAYQAISAYLTTPQAIPSKILEVPWVGGAIEDFLSRFIGHPDAIEAELLAALRRFQGPILGLAGGAGRHIGNMLMALVTLFFCYRDGSDWNRQLGRLSDTSVGRTILPIIDTVGRVIRAVVFGFVATVIAQGLVASLGYWILGTTDPILLGVLTGIFSILPVIGTAFIWLPVGIYLIAGGHEVRGVLLLLYGVLIIHPTDNLLRPLFISRVTQLPFLSVMFGVFGGLAAFGLIGSVIGPVLLGLGGQWWRQIIASQASSVASSPSTAVLSRCK